MQSNISEFLQKYLEKTIQSDVNYIVCLECKGAIDCQLDLH